MMPPGVFAVTSYGKCSVRDCGNARKWTVEVTLHRFVTRGPTDLFIGLCDHHLAAYQREQSQKRPMGHD